MKSAFLKDLPNKVKDAVAMEIYAIIHRRLSIAPLLAYLRRGEKYLVVKFEDGVIREMKIMDREVDEENAISIQVPEGGDFMKELYRSIRRELENGDVVVDYDYWYTMANADRWVIL